MGLKDRLETQRKKSQEEELEQKKLEEERAADEKRMTGDKLVNLAERRQELERQLAELDNEKVADSDQSLELEKNNPIQQKLADLRTRRQGIVDESQNLDKGYDEIGALRSNQRAKGGEISKIINEYKDQLPEDVVSVYDMAKHADFQDEDEVKDYKSSEEDLSKHLSSLKNKKKTIKERAGLDKASITKEEAKNVLNQEIAKIDEDIVQVKNEAKNELNEELAQVNKEYNEIFITTPEYQEQLQQETKKEIQEGITKNHRKERGLLNKLSGRESLGNYYIYNDKDAKLMSKYGEEKVRELLLEYWGAQVDEEIDREYLEATDNRGNKKNKGPVFKGELEKIREAQVNQFKVDKALDEVDVAAKNLELKVLEILEVNESQDPKLNKEIRGDFGINNLKSIAQEYVKSACRDNGYTEFDVLRKQWNDDQKMIIRPEDKIKTGNSFCNPEYYLKNAEMFKNQLADLLVDGIESGKLVAGQEVKYPYTKRNDKYDVGRISRNVILSQEFCSEVNKVGLDGVEKILDDESKVLEKERRLAKEKLLKCFETDLAKFNVYTFEMNNPQTGNIERQYEENLRTRSKAREEQVNLIKNKDNLAAILNENVLIDSGGYIGIPRLSEELELSRKELNDVLRKEEEKNYEIARKNSEDKGLFNRKAAQIERELAVLQTELDNLKKQEDDLKKAIKSNQAGIDNFTVVRNAYQTARKSINLESGSLSKIISDIETGLRSLESKSLSVDDQALYDQYQGVKRARQLAIDKQSGRA